MQFLECHTINSAAEEHSADWRFIVKKLMNLVCQIPHEHLPVKEVVTKLGEAGGNSWKE